MDRPLGTMGMEPSLIRARRRYRYRNAFTGVLLVSFIAGAFFYSIGAVAQEDFSDVEAYEQLNRKRLAEEEAVRQRTEAANRSNSSPASSPLASASSAIRRTTRSDGSAMSEFEMAGFEPVPGWLRAGMGARTKRSWIDGAGDIDQPGRLSDRIERGRRLV